jgi:hypothetical protein
MSNGNPFIMPLAGAGTPGTYNVTVAYHDKTNGFYFDLARRADSFTSVIPFQVAARGVGPSFTVQPDGSGSATVSVIGNITATGSITPGSDVRLKTNIQNLTSGIRGVQRLRPVTFNWRSNGKPSIGFIAQEVEQVFPQLVETNDKGYKFLDYDKITAVLVAAFQEARAEDDRLKLENAELRNRLDRLEREVQRLASAAQHRHGAILTRAP